jgi:G3E family GTPase
VDEDVRRKTKLDAIVTVVDAKHLLSEIDHAHEAQEQLAFADVVLLNKTDLVSGDELATVEARIRQINPYAGSIAPNAATSISATCSAETLSISIASSKSSPNFSTK